MPKVSVVLPVFNGEKYIKESIDSIKKQTFTDWELIIVNDCSTDGTSKIISEYAENDKRIRILENDRNLRLPKSLNKGFSEAKGEFLTWTSDDNIYLEDAFFKMCSYLDSNNSVSMVVADMISIDSDGNDTGDWVSYDPEYMYYNNCLGACFMYRRHILENVGQYDENLFLIEDYDYWFRVLKSGFKIIRLGEVLYKYRVHSNSLSGTRQKEIHIKLNEMRFKNFDLVFSHIKSNKDLLARMYYEMLVYGQIDNAQKQKILEFVPVLKKDSLMSLDKPIIVYGAGNYGDLAYQCLNNKIKFYCDSDGKKVGSLVNGIEVISIDKMKELSKDYCILVALFYANIYSALEKSSWDMVESCMTIQRYSILQKEMDNLL